MALYHKKGDRIAVKLNIRLIQDRDFALCPINYGYFVALPRYAVRLDYIFREFCELECDLYTK